MTLKALQQLVVVWANGISPDRRPKDAVVKMVSETSELLDAVLNGDKADVESELGDCIILLLDIANMYGIDLTQAGFDKMAVNLKREWVSENGVIRRKKSNGASHGPD